MKNVKVALIDDSAICRAELRDIVEREGDIRVVAEAADGEGVIQLIARHRPQVLLIDLMMPRFDGHATIERVMAEHPLPILVVTGQPRGQGGQDAVFESIRRGALDLAMKPALLDGKRQAELRAKIRQLAGVPVVRHVAGKSAQKPPASWTGLRDHAAPMTPIVGIGASAGGPSALTALLCKLPGDYPGAIAVVQHLPAGFADGFAEFLRNRTALGVTVVRAPTLLERSHVYLAPDDRHLIFDDREHLIPFDAPPVGPHRPSADALLSSLAAVHGSHAVGIVLSGIGQDGVRGLMDLRARGALTLAQDAATSAVYGMPRAAAESGAAARVLDPEAMAKLLIALDARFGAASSGAGV